MLLGPLADALCGAISPATLPSVPAMHKFRFRTGWEIPWFRGMIAASPTSVGLVARAPVETRPPDHDDSSRLVAAVHCLLHGSFFHSRQPGRRHPVVRCHQGPGRPRTGSPRIVGVGSDARGRTRTLEP